MEKDMQEFVSVIIPVYNRKEELKRAINSILNQSFTNYEIIIIDDGSTIEIKDIIKEFNSEKIRYIKNSKNRGVSFSRNIGIKESRGEFIAFLDSDDEWLNRKLELQLDFFRQTKYRVVHTEEIWVRNGIRVNPKKRHKKSGGNIFIPSLELCLISPSSVMIKREVFDLYGMFDENLLVCEDYDLWLRITSNEEVGFIDKPLIIKYGGHFDQLSKKYEAMDRFRILSLIKILRSCNLNQSQIEKVKETIVKKATILYNGALKRGKLEEAEIYKEWIDSYSLEFIHS